MVKDAEGKDAMCKDKLILSPKKHSSGNSG